MRILETKQVSKHFGGLIAVNEVSMHIEQGDVVGLIGPNGAGKTTLINAISGLNPPTMGKVVMFGEDTTGLAPRENVPQGTVQNVPDSPPFSKNDRT